MSQQIAEFYAKITADTSGLQKGVDTANQKLDNLSSTAKKSGGVMGELQGKMMGVINPAALVAGAFTSVTAFLSSSTKETINYANQVRTLSNLSGQSAESTSRFLQVLDDYKISADEALVATRSLTSQGHAPSIETLAELSDQYLSLNSVEDKNAFVLKNLGRGGLQWVEVLKMGSKALIEQGNAVADGLILHQEQLDSVRELEIAQDTLGESWQQVAITVGSSVIPAITEGLDVINNTTRAVEVMREQGLNPTLEMLTNGDGYINALKQAAEETEAQRNAMLQSNDAAEQYTISLKEQEAAIKAVSEANSGFLSTLGSVDSARDSYNQGVTESYAALQAGNVTVDEHKAKVAELAAQYEEAKDQIVLSIVEMKLAADGWTTAETNAYLKIGKELGVFSEQTVQETRTVLAEVNKLVSGVNSATEPIIHVGERAEDAAVQFGMMGEGAQRMGDYINSTATPAVAGLKSVINQLSDKSVNVDVYIRRHGSLANLPDTASPTAELDQFDYHNWTGGPLGNGWTVVGDMPGGGWGPYTELVSPSGYVFDAETSRMIKEAGMLGAGVDYAYFGSQDASGIYSSSKPSYYTPKPKVGRNARTIAREAEAAARAAAAASAGGAGIGGVIIAAPEEDPGEALAGIGNQVANDIQGAAVSAMKSAQQAAQAASVQNITQLREIANILRAQSGKLPTAADIGRAVGVENSKFS